MAFRIKRYDEVTSMRSILFLPIRLLRLVFRILFSRLFIFLFMVSLFIASHTVSFVADLTFRAIDTVAQYAIPQSVRPQSRSALLAENRALKTEAAAQRRLATQKLTGMQQRVRRTTIANVAAAGGEALPFVGIGIIVGATAYEASEACATMADIYDLQVAVDPTQANPEDRDVVCGIEVPTKEELWEGIKSAPGAAWDKAVAAGRGTADWAQSLERPDFSGTWDAAVGAVSRWFD